VAWSPDSEELLLYVVEGPEPDSNFFDETQSHYLIYSIDREEFTRLDLGIENAVITWGRNGNELLIRRYLSEQEYVLGWLTIDDSIFEEETIVPRELGPVDETTALSTPASLILSGDTPCATNCQDIYSYEIGSGGPFFRLIRLACFPSFSHDGSKLAYAAKINTKARPTRLMIANADGSDASPLFLEDLPKIITYPAWSPTGKEIAFTYPGEAGANAVYVADVPPDLRP
jgi:hypothetical protein